MSRNHKFAYIRILLLIPCAELAYQLAAHFLVNTSRELILAIGIRWWGIGADILLGTVFVIAGTLVVPSAVRWITAGILVICYGLNLVTVYVFVVPPVTLTVAALSSVLAVAIVSFRYRRMHIRNA